MQQKYICQKSEMSVHTAAMIYTDKLRLNHFLYVKCIAGPFNENCHA